MKRCKGCGVELPESGFYTFRDGRLFGKCKKCCIADRQRLRASRGAKPQTKLPARFPQECEAWRGMVKRCHNPENKSFARYGGRGITVCEEWRASFAAFLDDMGTAPSREHSIDRIDNSRGYMPSNCRWATKLEQARNKRNNRYIAFNGETLCVSEWAARIGLKPSTLHYRVFIRGWSLEKAASTPLKR